MPPSVHAEAGRAAPRLHASLRYALTATAALLPLGITPAQTFATLAVLLWVVLAVRERDGGLRRHPLAVPVLLFSAVALFASATGLRPAHSLAKCHRLFFVWLVFAVPFAAKRAPDRTAFVDGLGLAFVGGAALLAVYDVVRIPLGALRGAWLYGLGNMRDPQFFMAGLLLLLAGRRHPLAAARPRWRAALAVLLAAAMVLHFKRGVWLAFMAATAFVALGQRRWRPVLVLAAAVLLLAALPPVRGRVAMMREEWTSLQGGRLDLWTKIAPRIIRDHPGGIGFAATRNEDLRAYGPVAEAKLNHLHNNVLEITLELGWAGLAAWGYWMLRTAVLMGRAARLARGAEPGRTLALGTGAAFAGLMLNGLVEYNFGDGEILLLLLLLMGLAAALAAPRAGSGAAAPDA